MISNGSDVETCHSTTLYYLPIFISNGKWMNPMKSYSFPMRPTNIVIKQYDALCSFGISLVFSCFWHIFFSFTALHDDLCNRSRAHSEAYSPYIYHTSAGDVQARHSKSNNNKSNFNKPSAWVKYAHSNTSMKQTGRKDSTFRPKHCTNRNNKAFCGVFLL